MHQEVNGVPHPNILKLCHMLYLEIWIATPWISSTSALVLYQLTTWSIFPLLAHIALSDLQRIIHFEEMQLQVALILSSEFRKQNLRFRYPFSRCIPQFEKGQNITHQTSMAGFPNINMCLVKTWDPDKQQTYLVKTLPSGNDTGLTYTGHIYTCN